MKHEMSGPSECLCRRHLVILGEMAVLPCCHGLYDSNKSLGSVGFGGLGFPTLRFRFEKLY